MTQAKVSPTAANPAEVYEQFFIPAIFRHWTPMLLEFAQPKPGEHILDLACGTGIVSRFLSHIFDSNGGKPGRVVALDINPAMLEVARSKSNSQAPYIEWQEGNAESLLFPDGSFDLVLCQAGLMLFKDRAAAAREMHRVLKPGGRAVVLVWQSLKQNPFAKAFNEPLSRRLGVDIAVVSPSYSLGSPAELSVLLSAAGFRSVEVYPVQYHTFVDDPASYMELAFKGAAAAVPFYAGLDDKTRSELAKDVTRDVEPIMKQYIHNGRMIHPQAANIAVAYA